jgi:crotonobetainyl-CoA:carnitine CoA-transferase CaiB-like acyl-CoA transferase
LNQPLAGCRVLELGGFVAVPIGSQMLSALGAEVIKVERLTGDPARAGNIVENFLAWNVGKSSVAVDIRTDEGKKVFDHLVRTAAVVFHNLDVDATKQLGITYEECRALNERLIYCQVKAFGAGPYQEQRAVNPVIEALSGIMSVMPMEGKPVRQGVPVFDIVAGMLGAIEIVAAFNGGQPEGRYIEVPLFETALFVMSPWLLRLQLADGGEVGKQVWNSAAYDSFLSADGKWIFIATLTDDMWIRLCSVLSLAAGEKASQWASGENRTRDKTLVDAMVAEAVAGMESAVIVDALHSVGVPCSIVNGLADVLADRHVSWPGKLAEITFNGRKLAVPHLPFLNSSRTSLSPSSPPTLGQHTESVLADLGFSEDDILRLKSEGVIGSIPPSNQ